MRLLHTQTFQLHEFIGTKIPPYAILSHTWGEDEVSFQDLRPGMWGNTFKTPRYQKIKRCCEIARTDGFEYLWIDTCCIDKSSSAELSEAINSMYRWYRLADVCYAYLSDVHTPRNDESTIESIEESRWFTRGWTLQELIAPSSLIFYNHEWEVLGTKRSLGSVITAITLIKEEVLRNAENMSKFSVAQKMSWASSRETTRVEDLAYCLMGIFGINMPLLYGEGNRAFMRLQEEILRTTNDHTIFAWTQSWNVSGLLTDTIKNFRNSWHIANCMDPEMGSVSLTNNGIQLTGVKCITTSDPMVDRLFQKKVKKHFLVLNCHEVGIEHQYLGIFLETDSSGRCRRVKSNTFFALNKDEARHRQDVIPSNIIAHQSLNSPGLEIEEHVPSYRKHYLIWSCPYWFRLQDSYPRFHVHEKTKINLHSNIVDFSFGSLNRIKFSVFRFANDTNVGFTLIIRSVSESPTWSLTVEIIEDQEFSLDMLFKMLSEQTNENPARFSSGEVIWKGGRDWVMAELPGSKGSAHVNVVVKRRIVNGERVEIAELVA